MRESCYNLRRKPMKRAVFLLPAALLLNLAWAIDPGSAAAQGTVTFGGGASGQAGTSTGASGAAGASSAASGGASGGADEWVGETRAVGTRVQSPSPALLSFDDSPPDDDTSVPLSEDDLEEELE